MGKKVSGSISSKSLFWSILDCGLAQFSQPNTCAKVLASQGAASKDDFHIPEPWNGDICSAKVLFVSINPGFSAGELYPRLGNPFWRSGSDFDNRKVEDFFEGRFDLTKPYVTYRNGGHAFKIKMEDGSLKSVRGFWTYVFNMAKVLIPTANPLKDFAITELVHCKSADVSRIDPPCYKMCMEKHLEKIFSIASNVEYVIFIGGSVRKHICDYYGFSSPVKQQWYTTARLNGRETKVVFVDHNNARAKNGKRACGITYPQENLPTIPSMEGYKERNKPEYLYHGTDAKMVRMTEAERHAFFDSCSTVIEKIGPIISQYELEKLKELPETGDFWYHGIYDTIGCLSLMKDGNQRFQYGSLYLTTDGFSAERYARNSFAGGEFGRYAWCLINVLEYFDNNLLKTLGIGDDIARVRSFSSRPAEPVIFSFALKDLDLDYLRYDTGDIVDWTRNDNYPFYSYLLPLSFDLSKAEYIERKEYPDKVY